MCLDYKYCVLTKTPYISNLSTFVCHQGFGGGGGGGFILIISGSIGGGFIISSSILSFILNILYKYDILYV